MALTVIYLGDGDVGEAVVYGLPFTVGEAVTLPDDFPFTDKIVNNGTFFVCDTPAAEINTALEAEPPKRKGRPPRAG
jgi:hypothetical protein